MASPEIRTEGHIVEASETNSRVFENFRNSRPAKAAAVLLSSIAMGGSTAPAFANEEIPMSGTEGATVTQENTETTFTINKSKATAHDIAQGEVTVLARVKAKGLSKEQSQKPGCHSETGFWNSGVGSDGNLYWFWDERSATICPSKSSPTGWRKEDCANPVRPNENDTPPEKKIIEGRVIVANKMNAKVKGNAHSEVSVEASCPDGSASASAVAAANANFSVRLRNAIRVKGSKAVVRAEIEAAGKAKTKAVAKAQVECGGGHHPSNPNRPPQVEIDNPQHAYENGELTVCERESDPDGDVLTRQFTITRGNFISGVYEGNDPNEYCRDVKAPSTAGEMSVGVTVRDPQNATASAETTFPVVKDEF